MKVISILFWVLLMPSEEALANIGSTPGEAMMTWLKNSAALMRNVTGQCVYTISMDARMYGDGQISSIDYIVSYNHKKVLSINFGLHRIGWVATATFDETNWMFFPEYLRGKVDLKQATVTFKTDKNWEHPTRATSTTIEEAMANLEINLPPSAQQREI